MELAHEKGASRTISLQVSGAFHSPLMQSAREGLAEIVEKLDFNDPEAPIIANVTAQPLTKGEEVKTELIDQVCSGVQWQRSIEYMRANGIYACIEIGQGKVLSGLIKRIDKTITTNNIGTAADVEKLLPDSQGAEYISDSLGEE